MKEQIKQEIEQLKEKLNKTFDLKLATEIVNKKEALHKLLKSDGKIQQ